MTLIVNLLDNENESKAFECLARLATKNMTLRDVLLLAWLVFSDFIPSLQIILGDPTR